MRRELKDIILNFWKNNVPEKSIRFRKIYCKIHKYIEQNLLKNNDDLENSNP